MDYLKTPAIKFLTVDEVKAHLHIEYDDEDNLLESYIAVATEQAEHHCQREIVFRTDEHAICKNIEDVPYSIKQFVLLVVGDLYARRELSSDKAFTANTFFFHLLDPYILYHRDEE